MSEKVTALDRYKRESIIFLNSVKETKKIDAEENLPFVLSILRSHTGNSHFAFQVQVISLQLLEKIANISIDECIKENVVRDISILLKCENVNVKKAALLALQSFMNNDRCAALLSQDTIKVLVELATFENIADLVYLALATISKSSEDLLFAIISEMNFKLIYEQLKSSKHSKSICIFLTEISQLSMEASQLIVQSDLHNTLWNLSSKDVWHAMEALTAISKHNMSTAVIVLKSSLTKPVLKYYLTSKDVLRRKLAMNFCMTAAKHGTESSNYFVDFIEPFILPYLDEMPEEHISSCLLTIGCIAAVNSSFPKSLFSHNILDVIFKFLASKNLEIKSNVVWCLTHFGKHDEVTADALAQKGFVNLIYNLFLTSSDNELKSKCDRFLKGIIPLTTNDYCLVAFLVKDTKPSMLLAVVDRLGILLQSPELRKKFMKGGFLHKIQELNHFYANSITAYPILESIKKINQYYPADVIQFCSPEYAEELSKTLDAYVIPTVDETKPAAAIP